MPSWRRLNRIHSLKHPRIRADTSKYNLYNLFRFPSVPTQNPAGKTLNSATLYKQTWLSKSVARAYHGEKVLEKTWVRMFEKQANSVVPMNHIRLAEDDGRRESAGRGSGRTELTASEEAVFGGLMKRGGNASLPVVGVDAQNDEGRGRMGASKRPSRTRPVEKTPHMAMTFWPLERRLDSCVFRGMLASSARQARVFVTHGHVKVNGKIMRQPGYLMNPGDMFSVDPTAVMYGLGAGRKRRGNLNLVKPMDWIPPHERKAQAGTGEASSEAEVENELDEELAAFDTEPASSESSTETGTAEDASDASKSKLKRLRNNTRSLLSNPKTKSSLSARQKQALRTFSKQLRSTLSRSGTKTPPSPSALEDLETEFASLSSAVISSPSQQPTTPQPNPTPSTKSPTPPTPPPSASPNDTNTTQLNPHFRPRAYISAFAFIPRYLEINQAVCSGVYLRHPQCGPGYAEVPSPYGEEVGRLVFGWYVRRVPRRRL
ncbi:MAG: mitochondrial 37S ribosomal protein nam9 [Chrysothrix sp. TS-e1954]|nr:MAG: mitochondrial 37S ribosomal protein nam9 [Chrysothrix sp. TS-e1954]